MPGYGQLEGNRDGAQDTPHGTTRLISTAFHFSLLHTPDFLRTRGVVGAQSLDLRQSHGALVQLAGRLQHGRQTREHGRQSHEHLQYPRTAARQLRSSSDGGSGGDGGGGSSRIGRAATAASSLDSTQTCTLSLVPTCMRMASTISAAVTLPKMASFSPTFFLITNLPMVASAVACRGARRPAVSEG